MKINKNEKAKTLLVSFYDWNQWEYNKEFDYIRIPREYIYEVFIRDIADMCILFQKFGSRAKYKKPTDKNWYSHRAMMNRLFKKEASEKFEAMANLLAINDMPEELIEKVKNRYSYGVNEKRYRRMPSGDYLEVIDRA